MRQHAKSSWAVVVVWLHLCFGMWDSVTQMPCWLCDAMARGASTVMFPRVPFSVGRSPSADLIGEYKPDAFMHALHIGIQRRRSLRGAVHEHA